jgi:hypothetical protein
MALKIYYSVHKCLPVEPILCQMNPIHILKYCLFKIYLRSQSPVISGFPTNTLCEFLISPARVTCSAHLVHFDMIALTVVGEKYKLGTRLLLVSHHSLPLRSNFSPQHLFSKNLSLYFSPRVRKTKFHNHRCNR